MDIFPVPLDGAPGDAGRGTFDLPLRLGPSFQDLELHMQVFLLDPGSRMGLSSSNGLRLKFGGRNVKDESPRRKR